MADHIQIGDITPRIQYTGDGAQTAFTYPFPIFADADLDVYEDTTLKTLTTHYSVSGAGDSNGGTVTFVTAPANGVVVTIARNLSIARTTDFQESGEFRASVLNDELDKQTAFIQQVDDRVDRSVQLPSTSTSTADLSLPDPEADKLLGWNAAADGLENKAPEVTGATASTLAEGAPATASYDDATGVIAFGIPVGATGATGAAGADGSDGLFSGAEATVSVAAGDLVAVKDVSDSNNPKFVTAQGIAGLAASEDQVARDLALTAYIKADIAAADPAGVYGDIMSDNFTSDTLATKTNATYDAAGDYYHNPGGYGSDVTSGENFTSSGGTAANAFDDNTGTATDPYDGDGVGWIQVQFAAAKDIRKYRVYIATGGSEGEFITNFTLYASNTGAFSGEEVTLDNWNTGTLSTGWHERTFSNGSTYTYYRLEKTSSSGSPDIFEIEMMEATSPLDMTLRPPAVTLPTANPLDMSMYFRVRDIDAVTDGTDRVVKASIDGGTTWATATITSLGDYGSTDKLIRADADVSAQSGSSFVWEVTTANSKEQQIKQVASVAGY